MLVLFPSQAGYMRLRAEYIYMIVKLIIETEINRNQFFFNFLNLRNFRFILFQSNKSMKSPLNYIYICIEIK